MACLLQPECNFLHRYFRCWLSVEVIDMEVKITSMQGMHIFQRDRKTQLIKCTMWSMVHFRGGRKNGSDISTH